MNIAFYGSSLTSSYWNGAATYYRGLLKSLARLGHRITFFEPDVHDRQNHRDIDPPDYAEVVVYPGTLQALHRAAAKAASFDVVVKTSGVGFEDDALLAATMDHAAPDAVRLFWDVDAPATLAEIRAAPDHAIRRALPRLDAVLTYGGGDPVVSAYRALGARSCVPIYNALDPETHRPVPPDPRFAADLTFLGNRLPDREERVTRFFIAPAARLKSHRFILGGAGWNGRALPPNIAWIGHVPTADHNALNASAKAILNINRDSMAETGFSPPTRVFEAAGAGACLITDEWAGIDEFLKPGEEILVIRDGQDLVELLPGLTEPHARAIGRRALARVLAEHTYDRRARTVDALLTALKASKQPGEAA
jgi:spore maturation protein CgeB